MPNFRDTVFIYEHPSPMPHMYQCVFNSFQPSVAFHVETIPLICRAKQMTGFYMKGHIGLKWVKCVPKFSLK